MTIGGNRAYDDVDVPDRVRAGVAIAAGVGFDHSCAPEQGRLLSVLAGGCAGGRVGETGTGCGVGLAWMVDATDAATSFTSIERDASRAQLAAGPFDGCPNVRVVHGDWRGLRAFGPFDLLVLDGGGKGKEPGDDPPLDPADGWLAPGGTIVLDDFRPGDPAHDDARRHWLEHHALHATEVLVRPSLSTIVGRLVR